MGKRYRPLHYKTVAVSTYSRIIRLLLGVLIFIACAGFIYINIGVAIVSGGSMKPGLNTGDFIFYQKNTDISYGDVIVLKRGEKYMVKRVIALPDDIVEITDAGNVLINGAPKPMPDVLLMGATTPKETDYPVVLSGTEYFVLGDNRPISKDSRSKEIGNVQASEICGRVVWSLRRESAG